MKRYITLLILLVSVLTGCGSKTVDKVYGLNEQAVYEDLGVQINDAFYTKYTLEAPLNFDKYLTLDLTVQNKSEDEMSLNFLPMFDVVDDDGRQVGSMIDENEKVFTANLLPEQYYDISLVFGVNDSSSYQVYYNSGLKKKDEKRLHFDITLPTLELKDPIYQLVHRDPGESFNSFFLQKDNDQIKYKHEFVKKENPYYKESNE